MAQEKEREMGTIPFFVDFFLKSRIIFFNVSAVAYNSIN